MPRNPGLISIRFQKNFEKAHTNRPYWNIVAIQTYKRAVRKRPLEILGEYDPIPQNGIKNATLREDRIKHWIGSGARITDPVMRLLRLSGLMPDAPMKPDAPMMSQEEVIKMLQSTKEEASA